MILISTIQSIATEEKAILVGAYLSQRHQTQEQYEQSLQELEQLADTAGARVLQVFTQNRDGYDSSTLVGKGKLEEITLYVEENEIDVVIFNSELSPKQKRNIEKIVPCKVIDRTELILDIFALRARTHEGKLQVELAQLQYLLPRLTGKGTEMSRLGGGIGTRGPGETKIEVDRRKIRDQVTKISKDLEQIKKQRQIERNLRIKNNVPVIALVGYTNVGKSSLFNLLYKQLNPASAKDEVLVENKLFATLDTTVRLIELEPKISTLMVDTVGFIQDLPHNLVAAFRSTLEEVLYADVLLHVVDVSDPHHNDKIETVEKVLTDLGVTDPRIIYVYNKIDIRSNYSEDYELVVTENSVQVSVLHQNGIDQLRALILQYIFQDYSQNTLSIPYHRSDIYAAAHEIGKVLSKQEDEHGWIMAIFARKSANEGFIKKHMNSIEILERENHEFTV